MQDKLGLENEENKEQNAVSEHHAEVKPRLGNTALSRGSSGSSKTYHRVRKKWCWMSRVRRKYTTPSIAIATRFFPVRSHWNGFAEYSSPENRSNRTLARIKSVSGCQAYS